MNVDQLHRALKDIMVMRKYMREDREGTHSIVHAFDRLEEEVEKAMGTLLLRQYLEAEG